MPLNTRDLWLVLRAQDQTNRALNTFSRNVRNAGSTVAMAQLQAQRAAALGATQQARLATGFQRAAIAQTMAQRAAVMHNIATRQNTIQTQRATIAQLAAQRAAVMSTAAAARAGGATRGATQALENHARAIGDDITRRRALIASIQSEIAGLRGHVNVMTNSINARRQLIAQNQNYIASQQANIRNIDEEIQRQRALGQAQQEHERHLARVSQRMQQVGQTATAMGFAFTAAGAAIAIGLKSAIDTAVEYERQVRHTATQVDNFGGNLEELADIGRRVAKSIAVPFEQIQPALFDIFSSMEVNTKDAEKLLVSFSKAAVAGQVDIQDVSRATIGLLNAFQRPASDVNKLLDIQFQLVQEGVGSYEEWNQRIGLVTPSAVRAGQSIEVMMAALAASTRMGLSAARSGTAVARAFDALSNPKTVANLKKLGVEAQDASGKFRPFNEVLRDFRTALMKIPEKDRLAKMLEVFQGAGGTIEARRFLQNMLLGKGNLELFDDILKETANSAGSMEKAYDLMANSAAANSQMLANQWNLMKESIGKALIPTFALIVGWLAKLVGKFNELSPHAKRMVAFGLALASAFALVMGPLLLLVGIIAAVVATFVVAGSAITVVVAALFALVAIAAGAAAAFVVLWKKSEGFRNIIGQMVKNFLAFKDIILEFARGIKDAFERQLEGPLNKLWTTIETKVLPAVLEFYEMLSAEMIPKVKEASRILQDIAEEAFKYIGIVINSIVIPAIELLIGFWQEHKEEIKPMLGLLAQLLKWFLIIAGVIVGVVVVVLGGIFVAAIAVVVAAIMTLVGAAYYLWQGLLWVWEQIKTFAIWLAGEFVQLWNQAVEGAKAAWSGITEFFSNLWNGIVADFNFYWGLITAAASAIWGAIVEDFTFYWNLILTVARTVGSAISNFITGVWQFLRDQTIENWSHFVSTISNSLSEIWDGLRRWGGDVIGYIVGLGTSFYNAGRDIIQGLIDGIGSMISRATDAIHDVTNAISNALPGSPVKTGPLRVLNNGYAGGQIVKMIADGMTNELDRLQMTASMMGTGVLTGFGSSLAQTSPNYGGGATVVQNITVNTQEIDPRKNSAELGFELVKVL